jgi:Flp pilus assembly protein TadB
MRDTTEFDRQLGESVHMIVLLLRVGYPLHMIFENLARMLPKPISETFQILAISTYTEMEVIAELGVIHQQIPSTHLKEVVTAFWHHHNQGGELADWLEPVATGIISQVGVDPQVQQQSYLLRGMLQPA